MANDFREKEKIRYRSIKPLTLLFSNSAQPNGNYRGRLRDFCLADGCSEENIFEDVRDSALGYFRSRKINWHDGLEKGSKPSNHLCCSQSCCINFMFPMTYNSGLLSRIMSQIYPNFGYPLSFNKDERLSNNAYPSVAFEWIGEFDYLHENERKHMKERTRGANFTSADFAFRFKRGDGKIQIVMGEWKYTEEYSNSYKGIDARKRNYREAFFKEDGVFDNPSEQLYDSMFYEPFYQLMRLQLLAQEMEAKHEMDADIVSVLHISPNANNGFRNKVTSPWLRKEYAAKDVLGIHESLLKQDRFKSMSVEHLLSIINMAAGSDQLKWINYLNTRYGWNG